MPPRDRKSRSFFHASWRTQRSSSPHSHAGENAPKRPRKRDIAKRILQKSWQSVRTAASLRNKLKFKKPPQFIRWDLIGVLMSYLWGLVHSRPLPKTARIALYKFWAYLFKVNLYEMKDDLENYPTLRDFFTRPLKEGSRPIAQDGMASPVDGKVVVFGEVQGDRVEQVKGVTYPLSSFLGFDKACCFTRPNTKLYHCVLYLAPGDYHRFHSPTDWTIEKSTHFPGTLFPISPTFTRLIPNLFALNERIVLSGKHHEGFYSLTAVGAYNVGSISLHFDETVKTNNLARDFTCHNLQYFSFNGMGTHSYEKDYYAGVPVSKGEEIGYFNLGSTIVLIFEAENFEFSVKPGDRIRMGSTYSQTLNR